MEDYPKRTEKYKRREPSDILFYVGSIFLLTELLPSQFSYNWTTIGVSLGLFLLIITFNLVSNRIKGFYYTKWIVFIFTFISGVGVHIFSTINDI